MMENLKRTEQNRILIIIPAYNEEHNILKTVNSIKKHSKNIEYIVLNDGSTDNTKQILEKNNINHITLIHNLGIGGAVQTGYKYAYENKYDIAIQFDGDGQHDINYIEKLIKPIQDGRADMVIGSRFIKELSDFKSTKARRIGIKIISDFIKLVTGKRIYDTTSGFRAVNKKLIQYFSKNYPLEYPEPVSTTEILKENYKIEEVAVKMNERTAGTSSIKNWKNVYYMINVLLSIIISGMRREK